MPTSIKKEYKQLFLRLYGAEQLPKMDFQLIGTGTIDAYIKLQSGKRTLKTKVVTQKDGKVVWNQEMMLPIELPLK
jgi:Ca2+-dependent lipid-binding protein